nr:hypothetical protein [Desulfosarcina cetonica]
MFANGDNIAILQRGLLDGQPIQEGSILTVSVFQNIPIVFLADDRMITRNGIVVDDQMVGWISTNGKCFDMLKVELLDGSVFELDKQSDHLTAFCSPIR